MSTITREHLRERAREKVKSLEFSITQSAFADSRAELEEELDLARIALASLEAEAVAYIIQDADALSRGEKGMLRYFANISDEDINEYQITVTPLYTSPPAQVSVPDDEQGKPHPVMAVKGELGFLDHFDRIISERDEDIDIGQLGSSNYEALMLAALDAFRAAMLQGAEQPQSAQQNIPEIIPGGLVEAVNNLLNNDGSRGRYSAIGCGEAREKIELWLAQRQKWESQRSENLCAGNSPVIPDGWVLVPEEPTHEMLEAGDEQFGTYDVYRRMIAASPQQK